jgi:uracil-DNA glycosylase
MGCLDDVQLTIVIGQYAQKSHLPSVKRNLTETVQAWRDYGSGVIPLPHPSPRNNIWIKKNPWFVETLLPALRQSVHDALA